MGDTTRFCQEYYRAISLRLHLSTRRSRQLGDTISTSVIKNTGLGSLGVPPTPQEMTQLICSDIATQLLALAPAGPQVPTELLSTPSQASRPHDSLHGSLLRAGTRALSREPTLLQVCNHASPCSAAGAQRDCEEL